MRKIIIRKQMKRFAIVAATILAVTLFAGCDALKQVGGAYNFTKCKYDYRSITNPSLAGINFSGGISAADGRRLAALLTNPTESLPLAFTLNLDVTNPTSSDAFMHGLSYVLNIDGVEFTRGKIENTLMVVAGQTSVMPLNINMDAMRLLGGSSKDAAVNMVKNLAGTGDKKSEVSVSIRPTFMVGGRALESPAEIPVNFSFGGK